MMQIWFLSNGSYSLKNCHNPFSKAIQPPPLRQIAGWTPKILTYGASLIENRLTDRPKHLSLWESLVLHAVPHQKDGFTPV